MDKPERYLNFEQAVNFLEEKKENLASDVKKDMAKADATVDASPEGRRKYLLYGLSLVDRISPAVRAMIPSELKLGGGESDRELVRALKHFMTLRIYGYSMLYISNYLGRHVQVLLKVEKAALLAIKEAIEYNKSHKIPIFGGG